MSLLGVPEARRAAPVPPAVARAALLAPDEALRELGSSLQGISGAEARRRLAVWGPNALRTHRANPWSVLGRQLRSPILMLLIATAGVALFLGDATDAVIIGVILLASVGLGFSNEYRAERAAEALHERVTHTVLVVRDGRDSPIGVVGLVPGDVVKLNLGGVIPADIRLLASEGLVCDESILTGESLPVDKSPEPVHGGTALADLSCCLFMGTVVHGGSCTGVVVATGGRAEFGRIALGLGQRQPETEFQLGLRRFSYLLLQVAIVLTTLLFLANLLLGRPMLDSLLFSLAIAVGITPQLLPAVVSTCLATGTRALARSRVLVKRLVCIEDLGDMDVLVTDKTGTLTEGKVSFSGAIPARPDLTSDRLLVLGLAATEVDYSRAGTATAGANSLDAALWEAPRAVHFDHAGIHRLAVVPFDHARRRSSSLVVGRDGAHLLVTKGSPEDVLPLCLNVPPAALSMLEAQYDAGSRVIAVASRPAGHATAIRAADERGLSLAGFLVFLDRPKANARVSLAELGELGIVVKIATGDNARVAEKVCRELGLASGRTLTGAEVDAMPDAELAAALPETGIFARVSPEQKARVIKLLRSQGRAVGFLGDGVNDALALHQADVGISVDSAADVAKDAADVVLMDKDLGVLAQGVREGRRIFANTIKYVLMGTSSNFGNMFSAASASVVLSFLPMLPGQILLNNLLYDTGQLAIPGDRVDKEQMLAPSHWDIAFIRRFMLVFGPISSLFDFATFALMLMVFNAAAGEFRAGWFIESIATQTLIIFAIRTRRVPFLRSRPSATLVLVSLGVVAAGIWLPLSPLAGILGFDPLPAPFFLALLGMVAIYLVLVEATKKWFFSRAAQLAQDIHPRAHTHRIHRRAARFSVPVALAAGPEKVQAAAGALQWTGQ